MFPYLAIGVLLAGWTPAWMAVRPLETPPVVEEDPALGPAIGDAQLATYFTTPAQRSALSELQAGRPESALTFLPAAPKDAPTRWLKALALRASDEPRLARKLFEQLAVGPLADRALHLAALCAIDQGDGPGAERLLGQVSLRYVDADQVLLEWARQYSKSHVAGPKTAERIEEILKPILSNAVRADGAPAHLIAGDAQAAAGEKEKARAHYRAAWVDRPLSAAAESARGRERLLGPGTPVPPEKLVRRAELLLDAHRNREAVDQLSRIPLPSLCLGGCPGDRTPAGFLRAAINALAPDALPAQHLPTPEDVAKNPIVPADPLACRAKLDQGRAYRKDHEYAKARAALGPVVLRCADPDVRARGLYLLAQLESIAGRPTAGSLWEALARKFPQSYLADDALFNQAVALRRAGDTEGERALLRRVIDEYLDSDLRSEAIFRLFYSLYAEGKGRQGLTYVDQLAAHPDPEGAEEERARYWRARALLDAQPDESELGRAAAREAAREDLIWLVEERPLTYHGLLARGRLAELDPERARQIEAAQTLVLERGAKSPLHAGALARDPHLLAAVELLRMGLKIEASRELSAVERATARNAGEQGQEALALLAELFARAGDFRSAHALVRTDLRSLLRRPASALALRAAGLAFPLAFREQIARVSQSSSIPADLLQALMREESALDPHALSSTGALGLTQVMPATARMVARRLKIRGYQTARLLDPETNIRIGGAYLGELYARFHHPALALASYNAGPGTVAGWVKARGSLPLDAFVEEIPIEETRGYVKRCLRSFAAYQLIYGNGRGVAPLGQKLAKHEGPPGS
jgi:soluble lytic murein transglycosylase